MEALPIINTPLEQDSVLNRVDLLEKKFEEVSTSVSQNSIVLTEVLKTLKTIVDKSEKLQERSEEQSPTTPSPPLNNTTSGFIPLTPTRNVSNSDTADVVIEARQLINSRL